MDNKACILLKIESKKMEIDLEVPLDISANDLLDAINESFDLGIDVTDAQNCYIKAEHPIALLKGNKLLSNFGVRNGTVLSVAE